MNIVVCTKFVVDVPRVRIRQSSREPVLDGLALELGIFDRNALEAAVQLTEAMGGEVHVVSVGSPAIEAGIKQALAAGADQASIVCGPDLGDLAAAEVAVILAAVIQQLESVDLVLLGEGSSDDYTGQVPPRLAALLDFPQATSVRQIEAVDSAIRATQDLGDELEIVDLGLPALLSVTSELNTARTPGLGAILKAGRKPIHKLSLADLGLSEPSPAVLVESHLAPESTRGCRLFEANAQGVAALHRALKIDRAVQS